MSSLLYSGPAPLILASGSPRRRDLLRLMQVDFEIRPADIDEIQPPGLTPRAVAVAMAGQKARAVADGLQGGLVLGADTIVVLDGEILGKPRDPTDARAMLARLVGRSHEVITGLTLIDVARDRVMEGSESTLVTMRPAAENEIARYVETGEPLDKAGSYGAQGMGAVFVDRVEGCFYNVVGLPIARLHWMIGELDSQSAVLGGGGGSGERCRE